MTFNDDLNFEIRAAQPGDEDELLRLSVHLNTVNLPADREAVRSLLTTSEQSFSGALPAKEQRKYLFVLHDLQRNELIGTSSIVAQLGRRDAPYIFLDVSTEERYSRDFNLHFEHQTLRIGFSYDGPTELAGLVVHPSYRRHPGKLGLSISYVRFLFIAAYRQLFQDELLAELLPPLEPDGRSHLWDAFGKRFTNMTYREADRLSHVNKDFIRDLFPSGPIYATLLSEEARSVIGKVGHQTSGVEKMLRRVGFRYADRIDPFDGGPHFTAETEQVTVIQRYRQAQVVAREDGLSQRALVGVLADEAPYCRALSTRVSWTEPLGLPEAVIQRLELAPGAFVHVVPVP